MSTKNLKSQVQIDIQNDELKLVVREGMRDQIIIALPIQQPAKPHNYAAIAVSDFGPIKVKYDKSN